MITLLTTPFAHDPTTLTFHTKMKLPEGLLNIKGTRALGVVELRDTDGNDLREYGVAQKGFQTTCWVLTSPGDVISAPFSMDPGVADFADLVVDGILRDSISVSAPTKSLKGIFKRVCHQPRLKNDKRGGLKFCKMVVQSRDTTKGEITKAEYSKLNAYSLDLKWNGRETPSTVGSLEIQLFRKAVVATVEDTLGTPERAPTYFDYTHWKELNPFIDPNNIPPSFEIR